VKNHGFTPEEREGFNRIVEAGFIDTFREFEKGPGHYTWWSNFNKCRERNIGWRIDYFLVSSALRPQLANSYILSHVMGSDHCPIGLDLHI
jgi:exodeoxyribonuclease-3